MSKARHKRQSEKSGQAPGTLVHVGAMRTDRTRVFAIAYDEVQIHETEDPDLMELESLKAEPGNLWVNLDGLHETERVHAVGSCFDVHQLVLEDILDTTERPKTEDFDEYLVIIMKMLDYDHKTDEISSRQLSLVIGNRFLLSFQEGGDNTFEPVKQRLRTENGRARRSGPDYLAYCMADLVVDNYFVILDKVAERIELLEENLVRNPAAGTLKTIHSLKTDLIFLRRSLWPMREAVNRLINEESLLIKDSTRPYLRDIFDHTIHAVDTMETFRDMVSGMLDIYLSSVSNKLNEIMKVLTIIATIFIPLTFLVGWYGMNFKHMPELDSPWGYPSVILVALAIVVGMLVFFRRKKWI